MSNFHSGKSGLAIYSSEGKRLFEDSDYSHILTTQESKRDPKALKIQKGILTIDYIRFPTLECSLYGKDKISCWENVKKITGLKGSDPKCDSYTGHDLDYAMKVPTRISYQARATVHRDILQIRATPPQQKITCQPSH